MQTIALDISDARVGVCTWDGAALGFDVLAGPAALDAWLRSAAACDMVRLVIRSRTGSWEALRAGPCCPGPFLRDVSTDAIAPEVILAHYLADRNRWDHIVAVVAESDGAWFGIINRGALCSLQGHVHTDNAKPDAAMIASAICARSASVLVNPPLIVAGEHGPMLAADLAEALGSPSVFVPDIAAVAGPFGVLLADWTCCLREPFDGAVRDASDLRHNFAAMLDRACEYVTSRGYDLDDASCHRFVSHTRRCDDGGESNDHAIQIEWNNYAASNDRTAEVTGISLHVILETPMHALPLIVPFPVPPCTPPLQPAPSGGDEASTNTILAEKLAAGACVNGLVIIEGPHARIPISNNWRATRTRAGGFLLERADSKKSGDQSASY